MIIGIDASRAFSAFWGGPEAYSYYLIRALLKTGAGHRFRLYLGPRANKSPLFDRFVSGLKIENCELRIVDWPFLWTQAGLAWECLKNPPDVLFVPAHTLPIIRRPSLKTVVTIHDLGAKFLPNYHKFPQKYYLNVMTEYSAVQATKIIAVSEYTKIDLISKLKVKSEKLKVIYEGYDREVFYPRSKEEIDKVKRKYAIEGDYLLFAGTIQPRKNLVRLIEAFSHLLSTRSPLADSAFSRPRLANLVLAGAPGWLNEDIYQVPRRLGVEDRVKFLGAVTHQDLPALMSGSQAFVFPSLFEGFGLSPLEAMACGVPVVLSQTTSLPEVGGEAAIYVDPYSVASITEGLCRVLSLSPLERLEIAQKSIKQAQKFSWEKAALATLAVLEEAHRS